MAPSIPKILCPVDFSDASRTALRYAVSIADHFKAKLSFLTVSAVSDPAAQQSLAAFVAPALQRAQLFPRPATLVRRGCAGDVILDVARTERVDLMIVAMHGIGGSDGCGSTTLHLLRHSRVPLLIVPTALKDRAPTGIEHLLGDNPIVLAPVDFQPRALLDAAIAAAVAAAFARPLVLLHALPADDSARLDDARGILEELKRTLRSPAEITAVVVVGDPATEIARFAREQRAGLIVMGLRGCPEQADNLPGSIAYSVLGQAPSLILGVPESIAYESSRFAESEKRQAFMRA